MGYAELRDGPPRQGFLVDTDRLSQEQRESTCRALLRVVAPDAVLIETDIPGGPRRDDWTPEHRDAVNRLLAAAVDVKGRHRRGRETYAQTGVLHVADGLLWDAFVIAAPYAFDASVWATEDSHVEPIVQIADESQSIFIMLTSEQQENLDGLIDAQCLVPHPKRRRPTHP